MTCYTEAEVTLQSILASSIDDLQYSDPITVSASETGHKNPKTWRDIDFLWENFKGQAWTTQLVSSINKMGIKFHGSNIDEETTVRMSQEFMEISWYPEKPAITLGIFKGESNPQLIVAFMELLVEATSDSNQVITMPPVLVELNKDDVIGFRIKKTKNDDTILSDPSLTYACIHLVSGHGM